MELDPAAVALKFGFLAVLYLFLLWVARSALKDLRRGVEPSYTGPSADVEGATPGGSNRAVIRPVRSIRARKRSVSTRNPPDPLSAFGVKWTTLRARNSSSNAT